MAISGASESGASKPRSQKERKVSRKEALDRVRRVLQALWEALEIRHEVLPEVIDVLVPRERGVGKQIAIRPSGEGWEAVVELDRLQRKLRFASLRFVFPEVYLTGYKTGRVVVEFGSFSLSQERVVFSCYNPDRARKELEDLKIFRPLLRVFGIEDLEETLEVLLTLKDGEVRRVGPYLLVRTRRLLALQKGKLFGDLALDGKFLKAQVSPEGPRGPSLSPEGLPEGSLPLLDEVERGFEGLRA